MSELQYYLRPRPALEPIRTKGNAFWRDEDRFLIKGVNYFDRRCENPTIHDPKIDVLTDDYLPQLRRDIDLFQELGLNTIAISALNPSKYHYNAIKLLCESGFYILIKLSEGIHSPDLPQNSEEPFNSDFDTAPFYTLPTILPSLRLVDELADYPNVLGFMVSGDSLIYNTTTKIAEVVRAHIRDIKLFLHQRGGRRVPVGVTNSEILLLRYSALRYFTAGPRDSRIDFFAPDSWSWANPSDFQISGWRNMYEMLGEVPVPMFLRQFGAYVGKGRTWGEVGCLFSRDMTGVFSGGCFYCLRERGGSPYAVLDGEGRRKREFEMLKRRFREVGRRGQTEVFGEGEVKDYENWEGEFPEREQRGILSWAATSQLPEFPGSWAEAMKEIRREREVKMNEESTQALSNQVSRLQLDD